MKIITSTSITLKSAPNYFVKEIQNRMAFSNPAYIDKISHGYWIGDTPKTLNFFQYSDDGEPVIPRGYARQLITICRKHGIPFELIDNRRTLSEVNFEFQGALRNFQKEAVNDILRRDFGTFSAPTGSGKTIVALYVIAQRKQPALIIVHTKELLNQWIDRIETFLGTPKKEIGIIAAGKKTVGQRITVALVQSIYKCAEEVAPYIGFLIVDECHRTPSRTFTEAVSAFDSKYMLGLSATPYRRDKLSRLIYWFLGDVVHEIKTGYLQETGEILRAEVVYRETDFDTCLDAREEYSKVLSELTLDAGRNRLIAGDVAREARNGYGVCLVLSDRKSHVQELYHLIRDMHRIPAAMLTGDMPKKDREGIIELLNNGKLKALIATGQLIGEGFDCKQLGTLFLATPIKFDGRVIQYLGRVLRPAPGKDKALVYDYVDTKVGVLKASAKARRRVYG